jgi:hypothetical protein
MITKRESCRCIDDYVHFIKINFLSESGYPGLKDFQDDYLIITRRE